MWERGSGEINGVFLCNAIQQIQSNKKYRSENGGKSCDERGDAPILRWSNPEGRGRRRMGAVDENIVLI